MEESVFGKVIDKYSDDDAVEDGFLVDTSSMSKAFNRVTRNLFDLGYENRVLHHSGLNIPNLMDLMTQATLIVKRNKPDHFYSGLIELPSGSKQKIFIVQNESGAFTLMLPGDY